MPTPIAIGDEVAYSAKWLRSCAIHTGPMPERRGQVVALEPFGQHTMATIAWDDGHTDTAITANLTRVSRLAADAALADDAAHP